MRPTTWGDNVRAGVMATATSLVSCLVLLSIVDLTTEQVAGINLLIGNVTILTFLLFRPGHDGA